jgi:GTP-binding protein EngB required for normal cell division
MPGYGRNMRVSERLQELNNRQIIYFLESNASKIALAVHVLDISTFSEVTWRLGKKNFISVDVEMIQLLTKALSEFPLVAANKIDKANKAVIDANLEEFTQQTGSSDYSPIENCIFPVSAKTGDGLGYLKNAIHERLVAKGYRTPFKAH